MRDPDRANVRILILAAVADAAEDKADHTQDDQQDSNDRRCSQRLQSFRSGFDPESSWTEMRSNEPAHEVRVTEVTNDARVIRLGHVLTEGIR